ncbi:MAG TPA: sensor domain-containing diguanylate cyclase [Gemmatimonadaceae bacterium]|nr:sensor domain-containing diguanylate cyclase [Gemmatimonadaceae bacterium]
MTQQNGNEVQALRSALRKAEAELQRFRDEEESRKHLVEVLNEVMGNLPTEEIFHLLVRRLARALNLSHASVILANPGDTIGVVATAFEQPQLHDLKVELERYPEVISALNGGIPVLIPDLLYCPLYAPLREKWAREGTSVNIRSVMALPFPLDDNKGGVFLLRRTIETPKFDASDVEFAEIVVKSGVAAIQRAHAIETTRADNHRLEALAQTDPLTQLVNRRALTITLVTEMERVRRYNAPLAMLLVDLDHFKLINDTYGHLAGDDVLFAVASVLQRAVRSVDTVARYGGEEFVIVLPETGKQGAMAFAERIRERLASHRFSVAARQDIRVTCSIGVATYPSAGLDSVEDLFRAADAALYRAKGNGRNLVCS